MNEIVTRFFNERKELWLKKKIKASMSDDEVLQLHEECNELFSLEVWLPNASKRAGQISMATHPCTFSHPSSRKNKNGYVTSIIAEKEQRNDGLLRTGNVEVARDALGNAAALDVHKFLSLLMPDGQQLVEHIKNDTDTAKSLLKIKSKSYESLKSEFLEMVSSSDELVTSSKIKQVYFPIEEGYHQLSILTNSGMVYQLKKRLDTLRFGEEVKALKQKREKNEFSDVGYGEIYNLTTIGYGGTKPQNISVLNSQNGGKAQLLYSMPPEIKKREVRFPKRDFFVESLNPWHFRYIFEDLHNIYKVVDYSNEKMRSARKYHYEQLVQKVIEQMWAVRLEEDEQYREETSKLKSHQAVWLLSANKSRREEEDAWLDEVVDEIKLWIFNSYKKVFKSKAIDINGTEELKDIRNIVEENQEGLR